MNTKDLISEICKLSGYTQNVVYLRYCKERDKFPGRNMYYARKAGKRVLKGWLYSLKSKSIK